MAIKSLLWAIWMASFITNYWQRIWWILKKDKILIKCTCIFAYTCKMKSAQFEMEFSELTVLVYLFSRSILDHTWNSNILICKRCRFWCKTVCRKRKGMYTSSWKFITCMKWLLLPAFFEYAKLRRKSCQGGRARCPAIFSGRAFSRRVPACPPYPQKTFN